IRAGDWVAQAQSIADQEIGKGRDEQGRYHYAKQADTAGAVVRGHDPSPSAVTVSLTPHRHVRFLCARSRPLEPRALHRNFRHAIDQEICNGKPLGNKACPRSWIAASTATPYSRTSSALSASRAPPATAQVSTACWM